MWILAWTRILLAHRSLPLCPVGFLGASEAALPNKTAQPRRDLWQHACTALIAALDDQTPAQLHHVVIYDIKTQKTENKLDLATICCNVGSA